MSEFEDDSESDDDLEELLLISLLRRKPKRKHRSVYVGSIFSIRKQQGDLLREMEYLIPIHIFPT